jgi:hypothetical protein
LDLFGFLLNVVYFQEGKYISQKNFCIKIIIFSIFGFGALFSVLPTYGIYESHCEILSEKTISNDIKTTKDCGGQIDKYQVRIIN